MRAIIAVAVACFAISGAVAQSPFDRKTITAPASSVAPTGDAEMPAVLKTAIERSNAKEDAPLRAFTMRWTSTVQSSSRTIACDMTFGFDPATAALARASHGQPTGWSIAAESGDPGCLRLSRGTLRNLQETQARSDSLVVGPDNSVAYAPPYAVLSETSTTTVVEAHQRSTPQTPRVSRKLVESLVVTIEIDKRSGRIARSVARLPAPLPGAAGPITAEFFETTHTYGPIGGVCCGLVELKGRQVMSFANNPSETIIVWRTQSLQPVGDLAR